MNIDVGYTRKAQTPHVLNPPGPRRGPEKTAMNIVIAGRTIAANPLGPRRGPEQTAMNIDVGYTLKAQTPHALTHLDLVEVQKKQP